MPGISFDRIGCVIVVICYAAWNDIIIFIRSGGQIPFCQINPVDIFAVSVFPYRQPDIPVVS